MAVNMSIVQSEDTQDLILSELKLQVGSTGAGPQRQISCLSTDGTFSLEGGETAVFSDLDYDLESEEEDPEVLARLSMVVRKIAQAKLVPVPAKDQDSDEDDDEACERLRAVVRRVARTKLVPAPEEAQKAKDDSDDDEAIQRLRKSVRRIATTPLA
eukprot:TRINITY_DN9514_c0_g1_i1.p1 TRINITY_DN9514_c0_g1~~TRINITY_DN9514_c0_g1_i1.p1  ORF type:complete len:183 (-),score=43.25 TRINITY_DN9514_c0_g1_i1:289-759(-)